ncbi:uncharacterized protein LOC141641792 [Silene latifolia]|uniref:uncharacterized protein LOC141641792 n=1 Tax=Silene latifolia TaxID=37657 RepID=UPI003D77633D
MGKLGIGNCRWICRKGAFSWGARSIIQGLKFVRDHIGWKPGIVSNLNVWDKRWVNGHVPEPKDCLLDTSFTFLKDLRVRDICLNNGRWNEGLVNLLFEEESANQILAIPLSQTQTHDEVFWPYTNSGSYTVKSGYGIIFNNFFEEHGSRKDKGRVNSKWKSFCKQKLWQGVTSLETLDHLFRDCDISSRIWAGSVLGINTNQAVGVDVRDWIVNWILYLIKLEDGPVQVIHFIGILVSIWNLRNNIIFRGESFNPNIFFLKARCLTEDVLQSKLVNTKDALGPPGFGGCDQGNSFDLHALKAGQPFYAVGSFSSCPLVRIYVDASWKDSRLVGFGWVVYDTGGEVRFEGCECGRAESPLQAEALGLKHAITWANRAGILHLEISSDCLQLLSQWMGTEGIHHQVKGIMNDVASISSSFHCLCFSYVCRIRNSRAHGLAKQAMNMH